jgi:hypothetical protein
MYFNYYSVINLFINLLVFVGLVQNSRSRSAAPGSPVIASRYLGVRGTPDAFEPRALNGYSRTATETGLPPPRLINL